jgi:hypothetical protein
MRCSRAYARHPSMLWKKQMNTLDQTSKGVPARTIPIENRSRLVGLTVSSGTGGECAYCHKEIHADAVQYTVEVYVATALRTLHFHRICLHLWEPLIQPTLSQSSPAPEVVAESALSS